MEAIISYSSLSGAYVDEVVNEYTSLLHTLALSDGTSDVGALTQDALAFASKQAQGTVLEGEQSDTPLDQLIFYLTWSMYPLFTGITVCIGVLLYRVGRSDVRKRNLSSPLTLRSLNAQLVLSCLAIALASVAWVLVLGALFFSEGVAQLGAGGMAAIALVMLVFSLIPASIGFMPRACSVPISAVANSVGNIVGLAISFFGGAWFSISLMEPVGARHRPLATRSLVYAGMSGGCRSLHGCGRRASKRALHRARRDGAFRPCFLLCGTRCCEEAHADR